MSGLCGKELISKLTAIADKKLMYLGQTMGFVSEPGGCTIYFGK